MLSVKCKKLKKKNRKPDSLNKCPGRQTQPTWLETKFYSLLIIPYKFITHVISMEYLLWALKRLVAVLWYKTFWWLTVSWWKTS